MLIFGSHSNQHGKYQFLSPTSSMLAGTRTHTDDRGVEDDGGLAAAPFVGATKRRG
jgi:hypothetical protein